MPWPYHSQIRDLALRNASVDEAARLITAQDVRWECDLLEPRYSATEGREGRVSIAVTPGAAHDTAQTIAEARALWWLVDRPNAMIRIPATDEGLAAITAATAEGISVDVTLIFDLGRYDQVVDAYLTGLDQAYADGLDLSAIRSVASFCVAQIDAHFKGSGKAAASALRGRVAAAHAQLAYRHFTEILGSRRWKALAGNGAHPQRLLGAPTGAGRITEAEDVLNTMSDLGIDYGLVADTLERDGIRAFTEAWDRLLVHLRRSMDAVRKEHEIAYHKLTARTAKSGPV